MRSSSLPLVVLFALLLPTISTAQIVVNEIMYVPNAPEPEWVELYNASDTAVTMVGWTVQDRTTARPTIPTGTIPAKGYILLTRDTIGLKTARTLGSTALQLTVPSLNNTGDDIILRNGAGKTLDSVSWSSSWGGTGGLSLERVTAESPGNDRDSWKSAVDSTGATPGLRNSVAPAARDLALGSLTFDPDAKEVRILIRNAGAERSVGATVSLYHDENSDSLGTPDEAQAGRGIPQIGPGDSLSMSLRWNRPLTVPGELGLVTIDHPDDERPEDNRGIVIVRKKFVDTGVVINEFIYGPAAPEPEWIELYNRGEFPVDLAGWVVHDAGTARPKIGAAILLPGAYLVLTKDTAGLREAREVFSPLIQFSLPSLNNSSDNVVLRNRTGVAVDSIGYRSSWGGSGGRSVERRLPELAGNDSSSWGSSTDPARGTPGKRNSLVPPNFNLAVGTASFNTDANEVRVTVVNSGTLKAFDGVLILYNDLYHDSVDGIGNEATRLALQPIEPGDSITATFQWGRPLRLEGETGILLIQLEGDERSGDDTARFIVRQPTADTGLIVNEFMYDPNDPEPEWIELYNRGALPVDLAGWRIGDGSGSSGPLSSAIVLPGEYIVVTPDTATLVALRFVPSRILRILLPAFNNSGDGVLLRNPSGIAIDSFRYAAGWGGRDGVSLERKAFDFPSTDAATWTGAVDSSGGTPGAKNSWEPILRDLAVGSILFDADISSISAVVHNRGLENSASADAVVHFDANGNGFPEAGEETGRITLPSIPSADSMTILLQWSRPLTVEGENGLVQIGPIDDQRPEDNVGKFRAILPPIDTGVVVNEIMYDPNSPEPEWLELYNRGSLPVQLKGWKIRDGSNSAAELPEAILPAGGYVIVTDDSAELRRLREIPAEVLQLLHPAFNNSGDRVQLRNPSGKTIDEFTYGSSWGGSDGGSLERKSVEAPANDPTNWKSSSDSTGGTPGRRNSASLPERNIALGNVRFDPVTSTLSITIANTGEEPTPGAEAVLYYDENRNDTTEPSEELTRTAFGSIPPHDSATHILSWPRPLTAKGEPGIVSVLMAGDGNTRDNLRTFLARTELADSGVVVNEIMYAPLSPEPEWVELFNAGILPVDLAGWSMSDAGSSRALPEAIIEPGAYLVLTGDTAGLLSAREVSSTLLQTSLPSLNNSEDAFVLRNGSGRTVDSLYYFASWGAGEGRSLERRRATDRTTDSTSWRGTSDSTGGTPGRANSVLPPARNLALDSIFFDRTSAKIAATIRNGGNEEIVAGELILYHDRNENNFGEGDEEIGRTSLPSLAPDETAPAGIEWPRLLTDEGETALMETIASGDTIEADNRRSLLLLREPLDTGLVITEIMFDPIPFGELAGTEYIEVYNPNGRPVPLAGWSIADGSGEEKELPEEAPFVQPGSYAVIAGDSAIYRHFPFLADSTNLIVLNQDLGLNNTGDDATLRNPRGVRIDSIHYSDKWHWDQLDDPKGIALERLSNEGEGNDPRNWSSSVAKPGGTPGAPNSRSVPFDASDAELAANPARVSPDGDGYEDFTRISYKLSVNAARIVVSVYDRHGRRVARPLNNELSATEGSFIWDGTDDDGRPLPMGIYVLRIEAYDADEMGVKTAQEVITVARRL